MIDPSHARIIRQYCDGELATAEARAFEQELASDPELKRAVENEKQLCKCVCRCVKARMSVAVPAALEARVRAALAEVDAPAALPMNGRGASQPTWHINYLALAAVIAFVAGAVLFGIYFPNIDSIRPADSTVAQAELLSNIGAFVSNEHDRVASSRNADEARIETTDPTETSYALSQELHSRVTCIDLSEYNYRLVGGRKCGSALPCGGPSGHMLFKRVNESGELQPGPNISIFCVPRDTLDGYLDSADQRQWVKVKNLEGKCSHKVLRLDYPDSGLVYFLVTCDPDMMEPVSKAVLTQLDKACR